MGRNMNSVTKTVLAIAAAATAIGGLATPAFAQRDPAYAAARSAALTAAPRVPSSAASPLTRTAACSGPR